MTEPVHIHTYDNGLVLVAEPMDWLESAAFCFLLPAGCAYEPAERAGLGAMTCEMTQRGAGERDSREFIQALENLGVERGESVSVSHTSYSGALLSDNLAATLEIYSDLLRRPLLPSDQLDAGRQVALQELRAVEDDPGHKVMIELRQRFYPSPWGRASQGSLDGLEATSMDEIGEFFQQNYRPNGTILSVAGRFDWSELQQHVGRLLGDWQGAQGQEIVEGPAGPRIEHVPYESNQTQIGIAFPSVPFAHKDYFQSWGAVGVLSSGSSSRLFTEVREKRGLCYSVYGTNHTVGKLGSVICYAGTSADRAQETLDVMIGELIRLADGVEEEELGRLKARIKSALIMQQESSGSRSASIARDWYHLGRVRSFDEISRLVDELTCDTINAYLAEHPPADFTIVTLGPSALEIPREIS